MDDRDNRDDREDSRRDDREDRGRDDYREERGRSGDDRDDGRKERLKPPPDVNEMFTLKVDNVSYRATIEEIRKLFDRFGEVGDVYIPRDRFTMESRGFAFVRFHSKRDAEDAIEAMDNYDFDGRRLRVQFAKQRRPENPREFYSQRDRDRRGGGYRGHRGGPRGRSPPPRRRSRSASGGRWNPGNSRSRSRSPPRRRSRSRSFDRRRSDRRSRSPSPRR